MSMKQLRIFWTVLFAFMILAAFIVPFTPLLGDFASFYGAFLFWNVFAIIVIICLGLITAKWRDFDER